MTRAVTDLSSLPQIDPRDAPAMMLLGHDLRAALSEVMGGLRLIDGGTLPVAPRAQIARSRAACEALALLLEQAMTILLGEGATTAEPAAAIRTARLIDGIRLRWGGRAQAAGIGFDLLAAPDLPAFLALDPALIERILSNLLGNAFKHADGGHVTCQISATAEAHLQIRVQDDGPGFPLALLSQLAPGAGFAGGGKPGSGLGLRIVNDMLHRIGGSMVLRNLVPHGAEVVVLLPQANADTADSRHASLPDLANTRLLVADDNDTSRQIMVHLLGQMRAEVAAVASGAAAIGRIERESFDALLIDIEMPQFSGLDVIAFLRAMPGPVARLPILAVTAYWLRANREAIIAAGANAVLSKPGLTAPLLGAAVLDALGQRPQAPQVMQAPADAAMNPAQFDHLLQIAGPAAATELLHRLLEDLQSAERGLLAAARGPDWPGLHAQTHVLMALAGTTGALRLQRLCETLNALAHQAAPDMGTYMTLLPQTLESLDALIHFVGTQAAPCLELP